MTLWRIVTLLVVAAAATAQAQETNNITATDSPIPLEINTTAGVVRRLGGSSPGNVAACYVPFHNNVYPLWGGGADVNAVRAAIDEDFRLMSKYFTHVRTYYSQHFGIEVAPLAAKYGLKLYLGVFITSESWTREETNAAVNAIKKYSDTVEVVIAGNENLVGFHQRSWDILNKINEVKGKAGGDAWRVKYGTVQRVNEFLDSRFDWDMWQLSNNLDILGVNIYPFFNDGYNGNKPTDLLDAQWNAVTSKFPRDKIRLTETGFPTAGAPSSVSPHVQPSLDASVKYYQGVADWTPSGYSNQPKFWFQAFDRRRGDPAAPVDLELYFGFFTTDRNMKRDGFPRTASGSTPTIADTVASVTARSVSTSTSTSACTIEESVDFSGSDVGNARASTAESCFAKCNNHNGCGAFTWTSYNFGTCWFKSSKGNGFSQSGARSGVACKCNLGGLQPGVDYAGNDIGNASGANAEECISKCQGRPGCRAFTWSSYSGGTCWLKSAKGSTSSNGGVTSGVIC